MKVLFDQGINPRLRNYLQGHETHHAFHLGWNNLGDSVLIERAEREGFHVLVTTDKMKDRWSQRTRRISIVLLSGNGTQLIKAAHKRIRLAIEQAAPGSFRYIDLRSDRG